MSVCNKIKIPFCDNSVTPQTPVNKGFQLLCNIIYDLFLYLKKNNIVEVDNTVIMLLYKN